MTEEQIEKAARAYCVAMNLDPDADIVGSDGKSRTAIPRWKAESYEIRKHFALQAAIAAARED